MKFTREELLTHYDEIVPDLVGPGLKLLFVGINPGLWTAAAQTHFAHPGNRFYPALFLAGITGYELNRTGIDDDDRAHLIARGVGISNVVERATARADELSREEYREGGTRLAARVVELAPKVVAVVGITAYRTAFGRPKAKVGLQPDGLEVLPPAEVWALPNPSGLNAHATVRSLAEDYRAAAEAAGLDLDEPRWDD